MSTPSTGVAQVPVRPLRAAAPHRFSSLWPVIAPLACLAACSGDASEGATPGPADSPSEGHVQGLNVFDVPLAPLTREFAAAFNDGDAAFGTPVRPGDGLGPLYTRSSCDSCHANAVRGPGVVQKMSVVEPDGVTPAADQSALAYGHTVHPLVAGGGKTPIVPPALDPSILVTTRVGPPLLGRGYMEAVLDSEIERVESEQAVRDDGIHGRANRVLYTSEPHDGNPGFGAYAKGDAVIGRFGLKARIATLEDFTADAFQGDMGITSPLRPTEFPNPDGLLDDAKPGIDVGTPSVLSRAMYIRLLAIPERASSPNGEAAFGRALCSACHVPALKTRSDYPVAALAGIDAPVYTDFLLHRMGSSLADGLPRDPSVDGDATSLDWRTAPLVGLRFNRTYMHDGRARTVEAAIEAHRGDGSEATVAVERFEALSPTDRADLLDFTSAL